VLAVLDRSGGVPEEASAAIAHVLSGEASFLNGAVVAVDGGRSVLGRETPKKHYAAVGSKQGRE
jgi:hypothetical protein